MFEKLTLVSIYARGIRVSGFVMANVYPDGKVRVPRNILFALFERMTGVNLKIGNRAYCVGF